MAGFMGLTHYCTNNPNSHLGFELGKCETCGGDVQEANAVNLCEPENRMASLGLKKWEGVVPAEQFYNEDTDMCVCENCL